MVLTSAGNVGIGTTSPSTGKLVITQTDAANLEGIYINTEESTDAQAVFSIETDSTVGSGADTLHFKITADGSVYSDANVYSTPADVAEMYYVQGGASAGDVVEVVPNSANEDGFSVTKATGNNTIMGVISTSPGPVMNYDWKNPAKIAQQKPVALVGRVPVKVSEENGQVHTGDRLQVSGLLPGYAAKMTQSGQSIGIALEDSSGGSEGLDTVLVFINLGYQKIEVAQDVQSGELVTVESDYDFNDHSIINIKNIASLSGKWSINEDGTITAAKLIVDSLETKKIKIAGDSTVGRDKFLPGWIEVTVLNDNITENSTILITFRGDYTGRYWVSKQEQGTFTVKLSGPTTFEAPFDYWIVDTDQEQLKTAAEAEAAEAAAAEQGSGESAEGVVEEPAEEEAAEGTPERGEQTPAEEAPATEPESTPEPALEPEPTPAPEPPAGEASTE